MDMNFFPHILSMPRIILTKHAVSVTFLSCFEFSWEIEQFFRKLLDMDTFGVYLIHDKILSYCFDMDISKYQHEWELNNVFFFAIFMEVYWVSATISSFCLVLEICSRMTHFCNDCGLASFFKNMLVEFELWIPKVFAIRYLKEWLDIK